MKKVSITLTTCGRMDLLEKTISSFHECNTYPIDEFIIINDNNNNKRELDIKYKKNYILIHNNERKGLLSNIDTLFTTARNEYIFHLEDDWMFDNSTNFIKNSISILDKRKDIHHVWLRHEYDNPHPCEESIISQDSFTYKMVVNNFRGGWCGYSWNPGLRRKSDHIAMFPNGVSVFKDEYQCSIHAMNFKYTSALLLPTVCYHIGYGRSTQ